MRGGAWGCMVVHGGVCRCNSSVVGCYDMTKASDGVTSVVR